jgi:hypothetical protein
MFFGDGPAIDVGAALVSGDVERLSVFPWPLLRLLLVPGQALALNLQAPLGEDADGATHSSRRGVTQREHCRLAQAATMSFVSAASFLRGSAERDAGETEPPIEPKVDQGVSQLRH